MSKIETHPASSMPIIIEKFQDPNWTAKGEVRASVPLSTLDTLWINTGTLCNIECANCYIESSPENDRLSYISVDEVASFLDEIEADKLGTKEIGFTGGEPFMNPEFPSFLEDALQRGFETLILTNAMKPMQRPRVKKMLLTLQEHYGDRINLRISLDHYSSELHDRERGDGSFAKAVEGLDWLSQNHFNLQIAGRTMWSEAEDAERRGYADLISQRGWKIDAYNPLQLILFPEMDEQTDVPEITTACWGILGIRPDAMMCATSRMVIKRKGMENPQVMPCTLIAYAKSFEMGSTLATASQADEGMFSNGSVKLCHPHCAKFCVLGGGSCSV